MRSAATPSEPSRSWPHGCPRRRFYTSKEERQDATEGQEPYPRRRHPKAQARRAHISQAGGQQRIALKLVRRAVTGARTRASRATKDVAAELTSIDTITMKSAESVPRPRERGQHT